MPDVDYSQRGPKTESGDARTYRTVALQIENHRAIAKYSLVIETVGIRVADGLGPQVSDLGRSLLATATSEARKVTEPQLMKAKICLVGEHGVGKTSLIRRYVLDEFDDRYITTLGAKVSKKEFELTLEEGSKILMDMTIWDIMGSKGFRELLREAYFHGAQGILAVCDITREETLADLDAWVESVFRTVGQIPVIFAINKADLRHKARFGDEEIKQATEAFDAIYYFTSAKKDENVKEAFERLARVVFERHVGEKVAAT